LGGAGDGAEEELDAEDEEAEELGYPGGADGVGYTGGGAAEEVGYAGGAGLEYFGGEGGEELGWTFDGLLLGYFEDVWHFSSHSIGWETTGPYPVHSFEAEAVTVAVTVTVTVSLSQAAVLVGCSGEV